MCTHKGRRREPARTMRTIAQASHAAPASGTATHAPRAVMGEERTRTASTWQRGPRSAMIPPCNAPCSYAACCPLRITHAIHNCAHVRMCARTHKPQHKAELWEEARQNMALPVPFDASETRRSLDPLHRDDEVLLFLVYAHVHCEYVARCHAAVRPEWHYRIASQGDITRMHDFGFVPLFLLSNMRALEGKMRRNSTG